MKESVSGQKTFSISRDTDHSFEFVAEINGVTYINDSKATNAKQTVESINSLEAEIVLILGGDDLKTDYSWFTNINYYNIKTVVYFGRRFPEIKNIFNKHVMVIIADNLESAVDISKSRAIKNQAVLFSPACPSYDVFDNYKNRGNKFKELVLKETEETKRI
jgi:UDP-N-acetylmuramoylalanine--D-glutamate ligase